MTEFFCKKHNKQCDGKDTECPDDLNDINGHKVCDQMLYQDHPEIPRSPIDTNLEIVYNYPDDCDACFFSGESGCLIDLDKCDIIMSRAGIKEDDYGKYCFKLKEET